MERVSSSRSRSMMTMMGHSGAGFHFKTGHDNGNDNGPGPTIFSIMSNLIEMMPQQRQTFES
jgi:hypothetical protein